MAQVTLNIAGMQYDLACKDGEEAHLRMLGEKFDTKVKQAIGAVGHSGEARKLLLGALLLADELHETNVKIAEKMAPDVAGIDTSDYAGLTRIAEKLENLATSLELRAR